MSAIYTYGQWIDIVDRGTSGDQVMDILASWKVDAYKLLEDNHKLEAELARRDEIITRLKEDAERLAGKLISMYADEMYECSYCGHGVSKSPDEIDHAPDCPITLHRALMKELK